MAPRNNSGNSQEPSDPSSGGEQVKPHPPLDYEPLITLLEKVQRLSTEQEQNAALSLELAAAELNPSCYPSTVLATTLEHLSAIGTADLRQGWEEGREELGGFFTAGKP